MAEPTSGSSEVSQERAGRDGWHGTSRQPRGVFLPLLIIGLGVIFLMNTLGIWDVDVLPTLARLWPVLLILIGLDILIAGRSVLGNLIGGVVMIAVLFGAVWLTSRLLFGEVGTPVVETIGPFNQSEVQELQADIEMGAGELAVSALPAGQENAAEVSASPVVGRGLDYSYRVAEGRGELVISSGLEDWWNSQSIRMAVDLSPDAPLSLDVSNGAGEMTLDLSDLDVEALNADVGAGELTVILPDEADFTADLSMGMGELTVVVPDGLPVRLTRDVGIGGVSIDESRFVRDGDGWVTRGYEDGDASVDLRVSVGIGEIDVR